MSVYLCVNVILVRASMFRSSKLWLKKPLCTAGHSFSVFISVEIFCVVSLFFFPLSDWPPDRRQVCVTVKQFK